jgi:Zn-dependent protease
MVQRAAGLDRRAVPVEPLRLVAWILLLLASTVAMSALEAHRWALGWIVPAIFILILVFLAVLVHELAHAVAANAVGGRVRRIVVFPIEFVPASRAFRVVGNWGRGDLGGYVSYTLDRIEARRRHAIVAAAGPLANIFSGVAVGSGLAAQGMGTLPPGAAVATAFAILSVGMGLANLIPFEGSDGMRLLRYFRPVRR